MASWSKINLQNANSTIMEQLIMFHDHTLMITLAIVATVGYMMIMMTFKKFNNRFMIENQMIELMWTVTPAIMLIFIALPSLKILYMLEETNKPSITIKTIGHQWYWSYEYSDFKMIEFDSYMKPTNTMEKNEFRLMETDNKIVIPYNNNTRMLITSSDVIHSWTIPTLGVKADASPGRMNQVNILMNRPGIFFGQCSEICGANHSFMPIMMESINMTSFIKWIKS
uniref:Cytochrome c oxidase subunit 2 n=1 Tax=Typhlocybinae gen. 1 sp. 1 BY-2021a TaxID=2893157 RepID=A0A9E7BY54_9HEMI|nr:cytochrome c oxidase subunit II [Typhlocybinae gen. 1 sp. 1 BY-2021a]